MARTFSALLLLLTFLSTPAEAGRKAPAKSPRAKLSPTQVWQQVRAAYLRKDFKAMYGHWSAEDRKKEPYAKFEAKVAKSYDQKVGAFRALKFRAGAITKGKDGRRYAAFDFQLRGKTKRGGRMIWEADGWHLYRFH